MKRIICVLFAVLIAAGASAQVYYGPGYRSHRVIINQDQQQPSRQQYYRNDYDYDNVFRHHGYRGFVDNGYTVGVGDYSLDRYDISTTHGCQINPFVFVGGGIGVVYFDADNNNHDNYNSSYFNDYDDNLYSFKMFADVRFHFLPTTISPYLDFKSGFMAGDIHGPTFNASLGISLRNLDLSIGFNWLRYNYSNDSDDDYNPYWKDGITGNYKDVNMNGISFRIGVNF
ncbi:MAG: hypothetical protein LKM37_03000 [Bacteroidales bacterium]|jgi:hypothetical protein|nr:hypothetical protein [Bacteroidales bacterium]